MASKPNQIMEAVKLKLQELITSSDLNHIQSDKIFLDFEDFDENQFPLVQLIAGPITLLSQQGKQIQRSFNLLAEVVHKSGRSGTIDQAAFLELMDTVEKKVLEGYPYRPTVGVFNVVPATVTPDIHLIEPHYVSIISFNISYKDYIATC